MDWTLFILGIGFLLYLYGIHTHNYFRKRKVPYVKPSPFLGSMGPVVTQRISFPDFLLSVYNDLKGNPYGGMFQFRTPYIFLRDPDLIKTITVKDFEYFSDHTAIVSKDVDPMWGRGVFNLKDECGKQLVNFLDKCYQNYMPEKPCKVEKEGGILVVELKDLFTRYTNDVIATAAFGVGVDSLTKPSNEFYLMGKHASNFSGIRSLIFFAHLMCPTLMKILDIPLIPKTVKKYFRSLVKDTMSTREEKGIVRPDLVELLMQAKKLYVPDEKNPKPDTKVLEFDDLVAQAFLFFLAGFDTTATLLCFACHQIAVHPETMTKLQNEIDEAMKANGGSISYETLHSMKYLDMVISETLRLYPPSVASDRCCNKAYTLPSNPPMEMKPGDSIWIPIYAIHRDPEHFPNPDIFDPERFSDENKHNIKPFTFLPFGAGPRNRFVLMETKIALVKLLHSFNLKVVPRTPIPIKISKKGLNMTVDGGFWMGLDTRRTKVSSKWTASYHGSSHNGLCLFLELESYFLNRNVPYVKPTAFIGNMGPIMAQNMTLPDFVKYMYDELKGHAYGGMFQFRKPIIFLRDPDLIKTVTVKDFEHFTDHLFIVTEDADPMSTMEGHENHFDSSLHLQQNEDNVCSGGRVWQAAQGGILVVELKDLFTRYANDVIATAAFGVGVDSLAKPSNEFYLMGKEATNFKGIHTIATREEKGIIRPDLVQLLMQAKKGNLQDGNKRVLEDDDLVAQAFLFFLAGFDTTSTLLSFSAYLLAIHPEAMAKLQKEIDEAMKANGGTVSYETLHSLKYLDMVISESLRLYPPSVAMDRHCVKKYTLPANPPIEVNPGDGLWVPIYALHRDPEHFPNPDAFDPERFSDENKHNIKPSTYIPFGIGPRICIGSRFALMEAKIALVKLLYRFNLKVVSKTPIPIKICKKSMNMNIEGGYWIGLEMRNTQLNSH
ncbi:Cytochrome P450 9e2 [Blattella germanica]|nr:Cytochrome P450 9e2 [Blattella germanica]